MTALNDNDFIAACLESLGSRQAGHACTNHHNRLAGLG
jgi:hypothetical protein